ncbi:MAG: DUF2461 family protein, partial [Bacteroidetes bacterium]|nr:DUF2461 family protein [Bacteroidota bacterium]
MKNTLQFLKEIKNNNNKPWFDENKPRYEESLKEMQVLASNLLDKMNQHDDIETTSGKRSLMRIYR